MKVLVATREGQGVRRNDFCFVPEGELVRFGFVCDGEQLDGSCGCRRSLCGFDCLLSTTTFKVVDLPISEDEYFEKLISSSLKAGFVIDGDSKYMVDIAHQDCARLLELAKSFDVGIVLENREVVQPRALIYS